MTIVMQQKTPGSGDIPVVNSTPQAPQPPTTLTSTNPPEESASQSAVAVPCETGQGDRTGDGDDEKEPDFPHSTLNKLDDMINKPRWVVPVLPKGELEVLLDASINLCKRGLDVRSEACQRFFRDGLSISFTKILTDEAVNGWKHDIQKCVYRNCEKLVELCVTKLTDDWFPLLEILSIVFNPQCRFHIFNARQSESSQHTAQMSEDEVFARSMDSRNPRGWLIDLINLFGKLNGFQLVHDRFTTGGQLTVTVIAMLIRPFGHCAEVLTVRTIEKYFMPVVDIIQKFLDQLTDGELKKESKGETKNDALSCIIKALKLLVARVPNQEETVKNLEIFRLKMILRLLQISSFNGKMNALNEVNKVISNVSFQTSRHSQVDEDEWLTADKMAEWIQKNNVLSIVLRDSLHQPQYVEKLEKILRFMIKERALTLDDLDKIWEAQAGKHEAIVKNVHDLLAKLAWDFSPEQLDHLFECFQASWVNAMKKQREKLLELIRRLAEDDKEGVMAHKVLGLLWNLAHNENVPTEIMDQALSAQQKILDYSCSQDRDAQKMQWINRFVEELKSEKWVLPALKQIREICQLFQESQAYPQNQRSTQILYRNTVISQLQSQHSIVMLVSQNLADYMTKAKGLAKESENQDPSAVFPDGRFNHIQQVQVRLKFLRFLLKDGQLWLCDEQAKQIWGCLAENAVYLSDREACFKWFAKLMGDEPDIDPQITRNFFENQVLQLDPSLLTESGMNCFERFFRHENVKDEKLTVKRRGFCMEDLELIGMNYLWQVVLFSPDAVANKAIVLLKDTYTNLGPRLQHNQVAIHEDFIQTCMDRLKASFDTISILEKDKDKEAKRILDEATRMVRVLTVLREYVGECDDAHGAERAVLPLSRACYGKHVILIIRFPSQGRQNDDLEIWSHTNDTIGHIRQEVLQRVKANNANLKVELFHGNENLDRSDKCQISQLQLHDKSIITAKLSQASGNISPDSSSESSTGSPHAGFEGPSIDGENLLPGVLMSKKAKYALFLFQVSDMGSHLQLPSLKDTACQLLQLIPADAHIVEKLCSITAESAKINLSPSPSLEDMFFCSSPTQCSYCLEVSYSLLMPAQDPISDDAFEFQYNFIKSGGIQIILSMLTKNNFLSSADISAKRTVYLNVMKILKLMMTTVCYARIQIFADCVSDRQHPNISATDHNQALSLQQTLQHIPALTSEFRIRNVAQKLGQHLGNQVSTKVPDQAAIKTLQKLSWCSSSGSLNLLHASPEEIRRSHLNCAEQPCDSEYILVAKEALEVLSVALALCPAAMESLQGSSSSKAWQCFVIDTLILCKTRSVRLAAENQFFFITTKCNTSEKHILSFILLLFSALMTTVKDHASQSYEYFHLLCRLLNFAYNREIRLANADIYLNNEIATLKWIREEVLKGNKCPVEEVRLEGHLKLCKELLAFQSHDKKFKFGSEKGGANLIKELVEEFIFPASKIVIQCKKMSGDLNAEHAIPICTTPQTMTAAFDLLVALCTGCLPNLKCLVDMLIEMYYKDETVLLEWEYLPPIGPRPNNGFVGLKNAGATCYMNSLLQQLFMIEPIRLGILAVDGAVTDADDDLIEETSENEPAIEVPVEESRDDMSKDEARKDYNIGVLKHVQIIFGYLAHSKLQYYVPQGFWKHFKLWGEPVNLREQHDALEFFNSLVDSIDEAMKSLGHQPLLSHVLGGSFADQKICKDCPHRYEKEEDFTSLNVDIRNHENLLESLEQYVKGDLLEGANAYHCEKCNKKVDTVKRMVIKKLPKILAIQLKRFDYDWERDSAIKFNDYFEFPREFDMEAYSIQGLAKIEGEVINEEDCDMDQSTKYRLIGVVVHSGQASGGHYYSYILYSPGGDIPPRWYKFDDGDVSECKMDDDEDMKTQCFGGDYMGEVFDHMLKRISHRKQKRWWNAYILLYERLDKDIVELSKQVEALKIGSTNTACKMPAAIERCVRKQNIIFMHDKNQFTVEYFHFIRQLLVNNAPYVAVQPPQEKLTPEAEEIAMLSVKLASKFIFTVGFHTKKNLRGPANEWYEALSIHLRNSKTVRSWFTRHVLFDPPTRFAEYLLECPSTEVRMTFAKIVVFISHFTLIDGPCQPPMVSGLYSHSALDPNFTLSDHILLALLSLLRKEVSDHGRHVQQYFHLFVMYANLGVSEKLQLLKHNVPLQFILVALDEGWAPPIKYQFTEFSKLYSVVSLLVRCCDVSQRCHSSNASQQPRPNPHGDTHYPLMTLEPKVADILFSRTGYVKKVIEDCNNSEDTTKLLKFCCWENPHFSSIVLGELLWQVAYSYTYELRPYLDLLLQILLLDDSWQHHRIHNALKGIPDERDGLFDTIQRSKNHYQKRAYQCIKMMVYLFSYCALAGHMLHTNGDLKRKWSWAVDWLNDELDRNYQRNHQYQYNNWSMSAQSNETTNGYFLERSNSARYTLEKAMALCPEEEPEECDLTDEQDNVTTDDSVNAVSLGQQTIPSTSVVRSPSLLNSQTMQASTSVTTTTGTTTCPPSSIRKTTFS